jgi:hypothetical protein
MSKLILTILLSLSLVAARSQPAFSARKLTAIEIKDFTGKIKLKGQLQESWTWKDKLGENILVLFQVPEYVTKSADEDLSSMELSAFQFLKTDTGYRQVWKLTDYVRGCMFDVLCEFFKGSVSITDLNKNNIAETTILYKLSCKSDVSPDNMKLIMHEDSLKYALRGLMCDPGNGKNQENCANGELNLAKLPKQKDEWEQMLQTFGRYETEKEFEKASPEFLPFVRRQWLKYVKSFE